MQNDALRNSLKKDKRDAHERSPSLDFQFLNQARKGKALTLAFHFLASPVKQQRVGDDHVRDTCIGQQLSTEIHSEDHVELVMEGMRNIVL